MGNVADGGLSRVFRTEFAGPSGSACCRTNLLGIGMLCAPAHGSVGDLVFARCAGERDSDSSAAGVVVMGALEPHRATIPPHGHFPQPRSGGTWKPGTGVPGEGETKRVPSGTAQEPRRTRRYRKRSG